MIPGLHGKRWDIINTGLFFTEERAADMELVPFKLQAMAISAAPGNPLGIKAVEDLSGKKVAVECCGYEETKLRELDKTESPGYRTPRHGNINLQHICRSIPRPVF